MDAQTIVVPISVALIVVQGGVQILLALIRKKNNNNSKDYEKAALYDCVKRVDTMLNEMKHNHFTYQEWINRTNNSMDEVLSGLQEVKKTVMDLYQQINVSVNKNTETTQLLNMSMIRLESAINNNTKAFEMFSNILKSDIERILRNQ